MVFSNDNNSEKYSPWDNNNNGISDWQQIWNKRERKNKIPQQRYDNGMENYRPTLYLLACDVYISIVK